MGAGVTLFVGLVLIYLASTGRAEEVWRVLKNPTKPKR